MRLYYCTARVCRRPYSRGYNSEQEEVAFLAIAKPQTVEGLKTNEKNGGLFGMQTGSGLNGDERRRAPERDTMYKIDPDRWRGK